MTLLSLVVALLAATSAEAGPPDPRAGERLDGRSPPDAGAGAGPAVMKVTMAPVRGAAWLVLAPVDRAVGFVERHRLPDRLYEALTSDDRLLGVRPVATLQPGYGLSGGIRYFDRRSLGPGSLVAASVRGGARSFESTFAIEPPGATGFGLQLGIARRTDAIFGGTHGETRTELQAEGGAVVRYAFSRATAALVFARRLGRPFRLDLAASIDNRLYGNGVSTGSTPPIEAVYCTATASDPCEVDPLRVPGFDTGMRLARAQSTLAVDTRPNPRFGGGLLAQLSAGYARGLGGDPSSHGTVTAAAAGVIPLGDRTIGVHLRAGMVEPLGAAPVPFEELLNVSGPQGVRGLPFGRLRGPSEVVASLEYRWLLSPSLDARLFIDRGNAYGPRFSGFTPQQAFTTAGLALLVIDNSSPAYWQSTPSFGVQLAVTADDALHLAFAAVAP